MILNLIEDIGYGKGSRHVDMTVDAARLEARATALNAWDRQSQWNMEPIGVNKLQGGRCTLK